MFYSIFVRGEFLEYHVSATEGDCTKGVSMSRRINYVKHPDSVERCFNNWVADARFHRCKVTQYIGGLQ